MAKHDTIKRKRHYTVALQLSMRYDGNWLNFSDFSNRSSINRATNSFTYKILCKEKKESFFSSDLTSLIEREKNAFQRKCFDKCLTKKKEKYRRRKLKEVKREEEKHERLCLMMKNCISKCTSRVWRRCRCKENQYICVHVKSIEKCMPFYKSDWFR